MDPLAGDFRQNLIPVTLKACDGSTEQSFDVVTKGKHNDGLEGGVLVVSAAVCSHHFMVSTWKQADSGADARMLEFRSETGSWGSGDHFLVRWESRRRYAHFTN